MRHASRPCAAHCTLDAALIDQCRDAVHGASALVTSDLRRALRVASLCKSMRVQSCALNATHDACAVNPVCTLSLIIGSEIAEIDTYRSPLSTNTIRAIVNLSLRSIGDFRAL